MQIKVKPFLPSSMDFDSLLIDPIFNAKGLKIGYRDQSDACRVVKKSVMHAQYDNEYWPIVRTQEILVTKETNQNNFIKTIRFYDDEKNFQLHKAILVESLPFKPECEDLLYPSILQFRKYIYYFKRIYKSPPRSQKNKIIKNLGKALTAKIQKLTAKSSLLDEAPESVNEESDGNTIKMNSHLQLFRYDLKKEEEQPVKDFIIEETHEYLSPVFSQSFGQKFVLLYDDEYREKEFFDLEEKAIKTSKKEYAEKYTGSCVIDLNTNELVYQAGECDL